jgi:hypothetical protein
MLLLLSSSGAALTSARAPLLGPTAATSLSRTQPVFCRLDFGQPDADDDDNNDGSSPASANSLPAGWTAILDPASGNTYYWNESTGVTTWTKPEGSAPAAPAAGVPTAAASPAAAASASAAPSDFDAALAAMSPPPPPAAAATRVAEAESVAAWVEACGGSTSGVRPVASPDCGGGVGLACTKPARRGDEVLSVPLSLGLSAERALRSAMGPHLADFEPELADYSFIALSLLHERSLGQGSELAPWLSGAPSLLPPEGFPDLPLLWGKEGLAELDAATTAGAARRAGAIAADYKWLQANAFAAAPDVFPPSAFSPEAYARAVAIAFSRAVAVTADAGAEPVPMLLPLLDLANHASGAAPASAAIRSAPPSKGLGAGLFGGGGGGGGGAGAAASLVVSSGAAGGEVGAGQELRVRYGGSTSGELLLDYGLLDAPVAPVAALSFGLKDDDNWYDEKADVLEETAGLGVDGTWLIADDGGEGEALPDEMISFLRLKHMGGADAFLLEPVFIDSLWPDHLPLAVSEENEQAALGDVQAAVNTALDQLGGSVQTDLRTLAEAEANSREYALASVRYAERRALQAASRAVDARLSNLDGVEYYQTRRLSSLGLNPIESDEELEALARSAGRQYGASDYGDW